jgi:thiol-disulfide isomerase/thioredoxin
MRTISCVCIALCLSITVMGQPKKGEQVPDIKFTTVLKSSYKNLHAFQAKLLLIDFWTTSCGACLLEIPKLDSMQKVYPNKLKVLLVSSSISDTKERVSKAYARIESRTGVKINLPVILRDSVLNHFFPHQYVPHFAWLDSAFRVIAISDAETLSMEKIAAILKDQPVDLSGVHIMQDYNLSLPEGLLSKSSVSSYSPNTPSTTTIDKNSTGSVTRILLINQSIVDLIKRAWQYFNYPEHIIFPAGEEPNLQFIGKPASWYAANSYTYDLVTAPVSYDQARTLMQQDILRYFGYSAVVRNDTLYIHHQKN